jgi:hypothetical protein
MSRSTYGTKSVAVPKTSGASTSTQKTWSSLRRSRQRRRFSVFTSRSYIKKKRKKESALRASPMSYFDRLALLFCMVVIVLAQDSLVSIPGASLHVPRGTYLSMKSTLNTSMVTVLVVITLHTLPVNPSVANLELDVYTDRTDDFHIRLYEMHNLSTHWIPLKNTYNRTTRTLSTHILLAEKNTELKIGGFLDPVADSNFFTRNIIIIVCTILFVGLLFCLCCR